MRPRPVLHETEAETKTNYCETKTKKVVSRPRWFRDLKDGVERYFFLLELERRLLMMNSGIINNG